MPSHEIEAAPSHRRQQSDCVEDFASLTVAMLRNAGALNGAVGARVLVAIDPGPKSHTASDVVVETLADRSAVLITLSYRDQSMSQRVELVRTYQGLVRHTLFRCPATGEGVRRLYLVEGRLLSRRGAGLVRACLIRGGRPRSSALRQKPEGRASRARAETRQRLSDSAIAGRRRERRAAVAAGEPMGAARQGQDYEALARVEHRFDKAIAAYRKWRGDPGRPPPLTPGAAPRGLPRAVLDDHPQVDVRVLQRYGVFREGMATGWRLWDCPCGGSVEMAVDLRDMTWPILRVLYKGAAGDSRQVIGLELRPSGHWVAFDPYTGQRCEILALRDGRLASPKSLHLARASQFRHRREPPISRSDTV